MNELVEPFHLRARIKLCLLWGLIAIRSILQNANTFSWCHFLDLMPRSAMRESFVFRITTPGVSIVSNCDGRLYRIHHFSQCMPWAGPKSRTWCECKKLQPYSSVLKSQQGEAILRQIAGFARLSLTLFSPGINTGDTGLEVAEAMADPCGFVDFCSMDVRWLRKAASSQIECIVKR